MATINPETLKRLLLPDCHKFGDIFERVEKKEGKIEAARFLYTDYLSAIIPYRAKPREGYVNISPFCSVHTQGGKYASFYVRPTQTVVDTIKAGHIGSLDDPLSWQIIEWRGGKTLVLVKNTRILADRWVAVVDTNTVPWEKAS